MKTKASSIIGDLILLCIIGGIIYALYKTCIANNTAYPDDGTNRNRHDNNDRPPPYNERPPPYGFSSDYMPDNGMFPFGRLLIIICLPHIETNKSFSLSVHLSVCIFTYVLAA